MDIRQRKVCWRRSKREVVTFLRSSALEACLAAASTPRLLSPSLCTVMQIFAIVFDALLAMKVKSAFLQLVNGRRLRCFGSCQTKGKTQCSHDSSQTLKYYTGLPNKACPRLRDLATAPAHGITQPRTNLIREPCTVIGARMSYRKWWENKQHLI